MKLVGRLPAGHSNCVVVAPEIYGILAAAPFAPAAAVPLVTAPAFNATFRPLPLASGKVLVEEFHKTASYIPHGDLPEIINSYYLSTR